MEHIIAELLHPGGGVIRATNINLVSYQVTDCGMKVSEDDGKQCRLSFGDNILIVRRRQPAEGGSHRLYPRQLGYEAVETEVKRRGMKIVQGDIKTSLHVLDPDGLGVQFGGTRQ